MNELLAKQQADDFAAAMTSDRSKKSAHQINFEEVPIHTASREGSSRSPPTANKMDDHDGGTSPIIVKRLQQSGKRASHTNKSVRKFPDGIRDQIIVSHISVRETPSRLRQSPAASRWQQNETELKTEQNHMSSHGHRSRDAETIIGLKQDTKTVETEESIHEAGEVDMQNGEETLYQTRTDFEVDKKALDSQILKEMRSERKRRRNQLHQTRIEKPSPIKVQKKHNNVQTSEISSAISTGSPQGIGRRLPRFNATPPRHYKQVP